MTFDRKMWLERLRGATRRNVTILDRTDVPIGPCDLCGAEEELRPYGPKHEWICVECAKKDRPAAERAMDELLFGAKH